MEDQSEAITAIYAFPLPAVHGDITALLQKMILSYLVHNGYSDAAEAFSRTASQELKEDLCSIKKRQLIMKLVMSGKMGQAIEQTMRSYPGVLENNKNLLFMLMCRRFIEMINGTDVDEHVPTSTDRRNLYENPQLSPYPNQFKIDLKPTSAKVQEQIIQEDVISDYYNDVDMDLGYNTNDVDNAVSSSPQIDDNFDRHEAEFNRILKFGKEVMRIGRQMDMEHMLSDEERQMMADAFSLIAYSSPWSCPLSWQFCNSKREIVCSVLNSAILRSMNEPWRPALELCLAHASELLKLISEYSCDNHTDFLIEDVFPKN